MILGKKNKTKKKYKRQIIKHNQNNVKDLTKKRTRHYGIDLARIISMLFIINHHIIFHGGPLYKTVKFSKEFKIFIFLNIIFCSGVDIFGMISGFVGYHSHKYSNLLYIVFTTFFYNFGIALFLKNYWIKLYISDIYCYLYPLFITDYWYVTAYFSMYFFLPIINKGILGIEKNNMKFFLILLFIIYSCLGEIKHYSKRFKSRDIFGFKKGFTYSWLMVLYLYGSYLGRFYNAKNKKLLFNLIYFITIILFAYLRTKIILYRYKKYNDFSMNVDYTSPSSVLIAFTFVNLFSNFNAKNKYIIKIISFFSPLTFGIYLLHNHVLVRNNIIRHQFSWLLNYKSYKLVFIELICSIAVFLFCSIIDYVRNILFKLFKIRELCILIENIIKFIGSKIIF